MIMNKVISSHFFQFRKPKRGELYVGRDKKLFDGLQWGIGCLLLALFIGQPLPLEAQTRRTLTPDTSRDQVETTPVVGESSVTLQDNLLSLDIRNEPLRTVIERIATQGKIDVRHLQETPDTRLSIRFTNVPLVDGLKRLFRVAELPGYLLVAEGKGERTRVQKILFLPVEQEAARKSTRVASRPTPVRPPPRRPPQPQEPQRDEQPQRETPEAEHKDGSQQEESQSVFEVIKSNTTARRLLSQLVHPNEQVRERALERLVRLVGDDAKQAELLEFLEPLMDDRSSEDRTVREEARTEVRKLLRR